MMKKRLARWLLALMAVSAWAGLPYEAQEKTSKPAAEDIPALRMIADPYPAFNGIAVDSANGLVVASDPNRKSLLLYQRTAGAAVGASRPMRQIIGPETYLGMVAGVTLDSQHHEIFTANNDIEDTVVVMRYEATGNVKPARVFSVPHQAWGLALGHGSDEIAVTVEIQNAVVFYRRAVEGVEAPLRVLRGPKTGLADPHGVYWDEDRNELGVANHGNFRGLVKNTGAGCVPSHDIAESGEAGQFLPPSITIYAANTKDDAQPLRTIQGQQTGLDWPMGVASDAAHNTIVVANNGDNSVLVFDRDSRGNIAPIRTIRGERTGINRPMGVAIDAKNNEIWMSNYGDHTALAFDSSASGNVRPKRIIRSAPAGTPTPGFGNPMALAYDCKREEILVPN